MSTLQWTAAFLCAFLIGVTKTGIPGVGILAITLMALILPPKESTGLILPLLIVGDFYAVAYYRRHAVWRHLVPLLPWAVIGVVIGYFFMKRVDDKQLGPIIGVIVLALLILNAWRNHAKSDAEIPTQWWFAAVLGTAAGVTTMLANAAGPIMIIYLLAMRLPKTEFIGTGAWYFLMVNWIKVPFSWDLGLINLESLKWNAILSPGVIIGAFAGVIIVKHISEKMFSQLVNVFTVLAAINLIFPRFLDRGFKAVFGIG